jgi:hypothetical protein
MMGFAIHITDSNGNLTNLEFANSSYAEGVLRGLVHSGFIVTIKETMINTPDHIKAQREQEEKERMERKNRRGNSALDFEPLPSRPLTEGRGPAYTEPDSRDY